MLARESRTPPSERADRAPPLTLVSPNAFANHRSAETPECVGESFAIARTAGDSRDTRDALKHASRALTRSVRASRSSTTRSIKLRVRVLRPRAGRGDGRRSTDGAKQWRSQARQLDRVFKTRMHFTINDNLKSPTLQLCCSRLHARSRVYFFITPRDQIL
jgi:hypothetical protein